ncbi:MAG TPA: prolyl oligopeptidase family serine peptidase [Steroidobacteraceae bacterium]|nr:prolyl oligopeptidase family serine peptidase [Steroidobacteraceae bacterium]
MTISLCRSALLAFCLSAGAASAAPQPVEFFARRPQMQGVTISADGQYIAFISGSGDDTILMTYDRKNPGPFKRVAASDPDKFDIGWCRWANSQRVICGVYGNLRGKKYAEPPYRKLFAVNADGSALKVLEKARTDGNLFVQTTSMRNLNLNYSAPVANSVKSNYAAWGNGEAMGVSATDKYLVTFNPASQDEVIDFTPDEPDSVLITADDDHNGYPAIMQLNVTNGMRMTRMQETQPMQMFVTDGKGNPRLGWGFTRSGDSNYFARLDGERDWRKLAATKGDNGRSPLRPFAIGADPDTAYAYGEVEGREALWSIDLADKQQPKVLFKHPLVDVGEPILRSDRKVLGIRYDVERPYVWYANPKHRELIDKLEKQFINRAHEIIDASEDQKFLVVESYSDTDGGTYQLYDVEKEKLQKLGTAYPQLETRSLGSMTNILYKAADGTEIPGYLTVPSGVEKKNLPLVVLPHDGPGDRDTWKFSYLRTFLANRGYAVLQMNYRGSSGFGYKWTSDAKGDWGGLVYNDIQDATKWAVSEGIADPKRVCIMGWGFGGYEALLSATRNNANTYRCAVAINGIADLDMQLNRGTRMAKDSARRELEDKDDPADKPSVTVRGTRLDSDSPIDNASKVNIPVLLVHGTKDWQVQMDHTVVMDAVLSKAKKDVTTVMVKNATHDFDRESERLTLLKEVETFLAKNMN